MIDFAHPFLLIGLLTSLTIYLVAIILGVRNEFWTSRRLLLIPFLSFIPTMIGALITTLTEKKYWMIIPIQIIIIVIAFMIGISNFGYSKREPWKSILRIQEDK